ncbi:MULTISPECIES: DUF1003 domain-containing protein [unclassified Rhizobium]|uniref:DUF1003 domain-containing protein n=1 Tax=unclassified Rhizobium TaxID=2613769 RepID=UPI0007157F1E|nr:MULTISPECIES: DUF1003 domain-containing protein [unclassified Rhizobium]KQS98135.1 hypothetical protein ASG50_23470 [Rhizobium sp. Leaf386]KQT00398.1 hypothetical protein ASG42_06060 [Rhizobium sp. Leaf391]KQT97401.1 hypothetical protein ASG68_10790 [Rhizobium sp. Leaf453]
MSHLDEIAHNLFGKTSAELGAVEQRVLHKAKERKILSEDTNAAFVASQSFGDRLADGIARVGGSWGFIIGFIIFLTVWTTANTILLMQDAFDPYPFIFLNLLLSMIAALQAPIIMMSQNRQAMKDRFDASKDYEVNLKSEVELISLHHKIDTVLLREIAELRADVGRLHAQLERYRGTDNPQS